MLSQWTPDQAAALLQSRDVLRYGDPLQLLLSPHNEFADRLTITVAGSHNDPCMAIAMPATFRDGIYLTVHLVGNCLERADSLLHALPFDKPVCFYVYDAALVNYMDQHYVLEPFGSRIDLHADATMLGDAAPDATHIRKLGTDDGYLVRGNEWMEHYWDYSVSIKDSNAPSFGLMQNDELAAMVTIGMPHRLTESLVTREIIWVSTKPHYQRQGLAKRLLAYGTHFITSSGATAIYSVSDDNAASLATAKSVGYVEHLHSRSFLTREPLKARENIRA